MKQRFSFSSRHTGKLQNIKKQKKKYFEQVKKIIHDSDIILEVLDARFPEETRNYEVEKEIKRAGKKIIFILNKADLVGKISKKVLQEIKPYAFLSCTERHGTRKIRELLKMLSKKLEKEKVFVGIIGYPNTGKSSLINILIGKSSAKTGSQPGVTKSIQKIKLSENIFLFDSPGVIPKEEYSSVRIEKISKQTKLNARSYSLVKEPEIVVADIIREFPGVLEAYYDIDSNGDSEVLLEEIGKKKNFLIKGGEIDTNRAARIILKDWQEGKIRI